jgi:hypothetical protein
MIGNTSINFRFDLALTYHRVGDAGRSRKLLRELGPDVNQLEEWRRMPIDRSIEEAARVMESDPQEFASLLDRWENKNVETLGLQQARICRLHSHPRATGPSTLL